MVLTESSVKKSFREVKKDMLEVKDQLLRIAERLERFENDISDLKKKETKPVVRTVKSKSQSFVASKSGNKFHTPTCPFAQNIKPKSKITFKSKESALNKGYKACDCVK